jgi:radical SAM family uncharacterized protein/radical SAM-linked protein
MRYGLELLDVEKPGRYEGIEAGAEIRDWDGARLRVALLFPDVYEIGMSHLGIPILYRILNSMEGVLAERAYAPWMDMEAFLRREKLPLITRESGRPLRDFDLLGFTLQYELSITNVLSMLELGGVPLTAAERGESDPIVIGGGPVAANPEVFADFFDALFIGDGEEGVKEIASALLAAKAAGLDRAGRLKALGKVEGVYLPSKVVPLFDGEKFGGFSSGKTVKRRIVADLGKNAPVPKPIVPFGSSVHDRMALEVARGCTRGCRFCQAGFLYRPVREREAASILGAACEGLSATGFEEVSLLSLSTGDYSSIGPLLVNLMENHSKERVSVSLPSLRVDSFDERLLTEVSRVRKTGFTLAPEAGSQTLRDRINKHFTDEEIISSVEKIFRAGWKGVKLYFMIGLPFETEEDRLAIVTLAEKIARFAPPGKSRVTISVSNFVPKPHTPFQWAAQMDKEEVERIHRELQKALSRNKKIDFKRHDAATSALEGVIARGDRRVGKAIIGAYRLGCRMDGWSSEVRPALWEQAFREAGIDPAWYLRQRSTAEHLPWELVDTGVTADFLLGELAKAESGERTPDCRKEECSLCGVCDHKVLRPRDSAPLSYPEKAAEPSLPAEESDQSNAPKIRFRYSKTGPAALLSHLDASSSLQRAFRAAGVDILYSQGFNPQPRLRLGPALSLGTESFCELGELKVGAVPELEEAQKKVNSCLPEGLRIEIMWVMEPLSAGLPSGSTLEEYMLEPSEKAQSAAAAQGGWEEIFRRFWEKDSFLVIKRRVGKPDRVMESRDYVRGLWVRPDGALGFLMKRSGDGGLVAPELLFHALADLPEGDRALKRVLKIRMEIPREE